MNNFGADTTIGQAYIVNSIQAFATQWSISWTEADKILSEKVVSIEATMNEVPKTVEEQLVGKAQADLETFKNCVSGKMATIGSDTKEVWDTLVKDTNDLIANGLLGQAQANIKAFVDCSTGKQVGMVDLIKSSLTDLQGAYEADVAARLAAVAAGNQDEVNLLDLKIAEIKAKIAQLNIWLVDAYAQMPGFDIFNAINVASGRPSNYNAAAVDVQAIARAVNAERLATYLERLGLAEGGIVMRPTLAVVGESGPEAVIPLERTGGLGNNINITLNVQGSIDKRTAEYTVQLIEERLKNVLVEASSTSGSSTHKRIRFGS
jgi:hypothetical protein